MRHLRFIVLTLLFLITLTTPASADLMIIGNDQKISWDDSGKTVFGPPGQDSVSIVDITNR